MTLQASDSQILFETERLFLRKMTTTNIENLQLIFSDPIAMQFYPKKKGDLK